MDIFAVIGIFFGISMILIGQAMEGGNLAQLIQITAGFIVIGGTTGAIILSFPMPILKSAIVMLKDVFMPPKVDFPALITLLTRLYARKKKVFTLLLDVTIIIKIRLKSCKKRVVMTLCLRQVSALILRMRLIWN